MDRLRNFVDEIARRPCNAGYHAPPWKADSCLGMRDYARAHPEALGEPLLTKLVSGENLCDACRARDIRARSEESE